MKNTAEQGSVRMTNFQCLSEQALEQQELVESLGSRTLRLVTEKRWESALTPEEVRVLKRECSEAAEEYAEEQDMLDAVRNALKFAGDRVLAELWAGNQAA